MKKIIMMAALAVAGPCALGASTNLNYTVGEINEALGKALSLTNQSTQVVGGEVGMASVLVDNSFSATSWTDIDLSTHVGTNSALVQLIVTDLTGSSNTVRFRQNGETAEISSSGATGAVIAANTACFFIVPTDTSGVVEAKVSGEVSIDLRGFVAERSQP